MIKPSRFHDQAMNNTESENFSRPIKGIVVLGDWRLDMATGDINGPSGSARLEPKVLILVRILASRANEVVSREMLMQQIWGETIVGDDSLARLVSKLRHALGDDARHPEYIETISKRGYRLLVPVKPLETRRADRRVLATPWRYLQVAALLALLLLTLVWWRGGFQQPDPEPIETVTQVGELLQRAGDAYFQFSRADNEAAIDLYSRVLSIQPNDPIALAGLSNALTQRTFRYPAGSDTSFSSLGEALDAGHLRQDHAIRQLQRAEQLAARAVTLAPGQAGAHKALGFAISAQGRFEDALIAYERAIELDRNTWGALINTGDILEITGRGEAALPYFEQAYAAMESRYDDQSVRIRPWLAEMGVGIAQRYHTRGDWAASEGWYRRVLEHTPLHIEATRGLAQVFRQGGDAQGAERLCEELRERLGPSAKC